MINKIIASILFVCLLVAISIKVFNPDITHVDLSTPFISLLKNTSIELQGYKISIPSIPQIPLMENVTGFALILNAFITFVNGFSALLNFIITVVNTLIQVLQFLFVLLKNFISFRDLLTSQ